MNAPRAVSAPIDPPRRSLLRTIAHGVRALALMMVRRRGHGWQRGTMQERMLDAEVRHRALELSNRSKS